jgi:hypothetical protein
MTDTATRGGVEPTLTSRDPAYASMRRALSIQQNAAPRGRVARLLGRSPLNPDARASYEGALGELETVRALSRIGAGWTVLHSVPVGGGEPNIDHLVIGPGGVFTLSSRNHSGKRVWIAGTTFMVNGIKQLHVRSAQYEAARVSQLLSAALDDAVDVDVVPLIVVTGAQSIAVGSTLPAVEVRSSGQLHRWFRKRRHVLSDAAVGRISRVAVLRGTWRASGTPLFDASADLERFAALRHQVDAAAECTRIWAVIGAMAALAVVTALVWSVLIPLAADALH